MIVFQCQWVQNEFRGLLVVTQNQEKEAAAAASLSFVKDGDVVGLGTGSTATYLIQLLAKRVQQGLKIRAIPTSNRTRQLAQESGIQIVTFSEIERIDVTIDGADEIDPKLQLIKGRGGALFHEKVVASASKQMVVIADASKRVPVLGSGPVPVEVIAFALPLVKRELEALGASAALRQAGGAPFVTDEGHHILDCSFGKIPDPATLGPKLKEIPGVVEHGLFVDLATVALVAEGSQVHTLRRNLAART